MKQLTLTVLVLVCGRLSAAETNPIPYPPIPEAVSSFGAVTAGEYIYAFGGHMGRVSGNSLDVLSPHFVRLKLSAPAEGWEKLPMQDSSQSPGLVAWAGKVYRVGGLSFKNKFGEETIYHSLDVFAKFDPDTKTWTNLPALPKPRSSLEVAVVDGKLYVVGGWNLQGPNAQAGEWDEDALVFDLANENSQWQPIAKPGFQTRALAAAAHDHQLYVLGGITRAGQTTRNVFIYDPATNAWTPGPELEAGGMFGGFAIAACDVGGQLCYSGGDGTSYRLKADRTGWEIIERQLFPRMFHRAVSVSDTQMAVLGGVAGGGGGYLSNLELVTLGGVPERVKTAHWTLEHGGAARHSQVLLMQGNTLYAFGGNRSPQPHDFTKEAFLRESFKFDLVQRTFEKLDDLPQPVQSGAAFVAGSRIDQSIYVVGGLGPHGDAYHSTNAIQQYRLRSKAWAEEVQSLPAGRAMFDVAVHNGTAWMFGGSGVKTEAPGLIADTWTWNPVDDKPISVAEGAALPIPRRSFGGAVLAGKFYAVGGLGQSGEIVSAVNVFDFESGKWSEAAAPRQPRVFPSLAVAGGKLYLAGGFAKIDGHFAAEKSIEVYDPQANAWQVVLADVAFHTERMTMLSCSDRLLFYSPAGEQAGVAHFTLVDPAPQTAGFGPLPPATDDRVVDGAELARSLMRMDRNKDGKIEKDEVRGRFVAIFEKADANKDGVVTQEEVDAYVRSQAPMPPARTGGAGGG